MNFKYDQQTLDSKNQRILETKMVEIKVIEQLIPEFQRIHYISLQQQIMPGQAKKAKSKAKEHRYKKYDRKKRMNLIYLVQTECKSVASSAKLLGIAQTTARLIMKTWQQQRRVFERRADKTKRERKEHQKAAQKRRRQRVKLKRQAKRQMIESQHEQEPAKEVKIEEIEPQTNLKKRMTLQTSSLESNVISTSQAGFPYLVFFPPAFYW